MLVIKNILYFSMFLLSLNVDALNSLSTNQSSQEYLKIMLENNDKFSIHNDFLVNNFYRQATHKKDIPAYVFIGTIFSELSERLAKYQILSSASIKKSKKKTSQSKKHKKNNKKNSDKLQKMLLKEIADRCGDYIFFRPSAGLELFRTILHKGVKIPESNMHIPLAFLQPEIAQEHGKNCSLLVDKALAPIDNYVKMILDFFTALMAEQSHLSEYIKPYLNIELEDKLIDDGIIAYALKPDKNHKAEGESPQVPAIDSSKTRIQNNYIAFMRQENGEYVGAAISNSSKDLFWIISKLDVNPSGEYSKLYTNFKPSKSGFLFTMVGQSIIFQCYHSGESVLPFSQWTRVEKSEKDSAGALKPGNRLLISFNIELQTTVRFIEFDDIAHLQKIIDEIHEAGFLNQFILLDIIEWLLKNAVDTSIVQEAYPSFYPKKLIQQRRREREEQQGRELIQANKKLEKHFIKGEQPAKSPRVYQEMLDDLLGRKKSIGNRMLQTCVGWWWKAHEKDLKETRRKGSHLQAEGAQGQPTKTIVFPHGPKAKFGISSKEVKRRLKDEETI